MIKNGMLKKIMCIILVIITLFSVCSTGVSAQGNDYEAFLNKLGYIESRNDYTVVNEYGYMGRWQLGMESLEDIGFVDSAGNWTELANSFGVYSKQDFLNTPAAQDYAIRLYDKKVWAYIQYLGDDKYIGTQFQGITVTLSGLIAAAHLVGVYGVHEMFMTGEVTTDVLGNKCTYYLENLAGYDIAGFLGADLSKYVVTALKKAKIMSKVNLYGNVSGCNYLLGTDFSSKLDNDIYSRNEEVYSLSIDTKEKYGSFNSLRIEGKKNGSSGNDVTVNTDLNGNVENDGYIGDYKKLTFSFYAKSNVDGMKMYWRWGYGKYYAPITLSKEWKKYSVTVTKTNSEGSKIHFYFGKTGNVYLNQMMLVDGDGTPSLYSSETSKCIKTVEAIYGSTYGTLPKPTRNGYKFVGWYTSKVGGKKVDSTTQVYDNSLNVYARWEKISGYIPEKSLEFGGHYYTLFNDDLTWEEAKNACERMGGHLVTVTSNEENEAVKTLASNGTKSLYWIGAYGDGKGNWKWVGNEAFTFTAWADRQPSNKNEKYAHIYGRSEAGTNKVGKWNDVASSKSETSFYSVKNIGYICEFEPEKLIFTSEKVNGNSTYRVFDTQISWHNAKYYCEIMGGNLLTVKDKKENDFVSGMVKAGKSDYYWIGLTNRTDDGKYGWVTQEKNDFSAWKNGEPTSKSVAESTENFGQIQKSDFKWYDNKNIGTDKKKTGFIMETDKSLSTVKSIQVISRPKKVAYHIGEMLNTDGMSINAVMEDSTEKRLEYGFICTPSTFTQSGLQKIQVKYAEHTAEFEVYVYKSENSVVVSSLGFENENVKVKIGKTVNQQPEIMPENAECKCVTWSSDNEDIATVDEDGNVIGVKKGTAVIKATSFDGTVSAQYTVKVSRTFWQWTKYYILFGWVNK